MTKFDYCDPVRVVADADAKYRPGEIASVIAIFHDRPSGSHFAGFPDGVIYSVEFEDGVAIEIAEQDLLPVDPAQINCGDSE